MYCWKGKRVTVRLKGSNQWLATWWLVTSRAHEMSIMRTILFNIFIDNLDDETKHILSKCKGDTKLGRAFDMLNVRVQPKQTLRNLRTLSKETS